MRILVTGTAGSIGYHLAKSLIARGEDVIGLDSINDYYDVRIKYARLADTGITREAIEYNRPVRSNVHPNYSFIKLNLEDKTNLYRLFAEHGFERVCNLAAQAGVRYSLTNPDAYVTSNIVGFVNIIEACRHNDIEHLAYASSSSVYGLNESMPFSTSSNVDHPVSLYAASKKSLGTKAQKNMLPIQPGDVPATWADVTDLAEDFAYQPDTPIQQGVDRFIEWYRKFYGILNLTCERRLLISNCVLMI